MIKRYDLGQICLGGQGNDTIYGPGIVEREDGGYVRYEDYAAAMESIGAGGVSGRITSKSIDEHRAEFEEWYLDHIKPKLRPEKGVVYYTNNPSFVAWKAWKQARGIRE